MFKTRTYRKKDGTISSIKTSSPGNFFTYNGSGAMTGSGMKMGNITTYYDSTFKPKKFGVKSFGKTTYYNSKFRPYK